MYNAVEMITVVLWQRRIGLRKVTVALETKKESFTSHTSSCPFTNMPGRYLQLTEQSATLWEEAPNEFLEQDEGEEEEGKGVTAGGARSAGLSLIRELCDAFPEKVAILPVCPRKIPCRGGMFSAFFFFVCVCVCVVAH